MNSQVSTSEDITPANSIEQFIQQGLYLRNWSQRTARTYRIALRTIPSELTKASLNAFVVALRERKLSTGGVNLRIRSLNSFLTWMHEEGHTSERLRVKLLRAERKVITTLSDQDVRLLMNYRPSGVNDLRIWTLMMMLLDTGLRIEEALSAKWADVNFDDLLVKVLGKGSKERTVPISLEMRKHLFRFRKSADPSRSFVFSTSNGRLSYRNAYRDIQTLAKKLRIKGPIKPHSLRHKFAVSYICRGGDVYRLSRCLGHSSISTTELYLRSLSAENLRERHDALSILSSQR
jgi:site-specific recombinase XerD